MGKRQTLTYGKYPELCLADATERHIGQRTEQDVANREIFRDIDLHTLVESELESGAVR